MMKTTLLAAAAVIALAGPAMAETAMRNYETATYDEGKSVVYGENGQETIVNTNSDSYAGAVSATSKSATHPEDSESPYTSQPDPTKIAQ
ncbi:MAG: hypothetical protein IPI58_08900 [Alphaproteobacteria bacterium]|nr:MAG: hypothetical protein IPI58_08900 [Alphaproteobacteria bacterium]